MSRYLVGIDLGTTNTVVYYIDREADETKSSVFNIPQLTEFGEIVESDTLPSFIYLPDSREIPDNGLDMDWSQSANFCIGDFARKNSTKSPDKVIASAKSWLCADSVDRLSPILPWNRKDSDSQISPVESVKRIIEHIKDSWNYTMASENADYSLDKQEVVLTIPASFDAVARDLTYKAAEQAELNIVLLEEPQSAFYSWLDEKQDSWRNEILADDVVLVCDIGGGTTDFSLIKVKDNEGNLELERIAVGSHILLGGDNMDLTLAYSAAAKFKKDNSLNLDAYQISGLTHACREAKEILMADPDAEPQKLTVLGRGSSLIGGTISTELTYDAVKDVLIDGFFPKCALADKPKENSRSGFKIFGLNYESDPGITRHLASFLSKHCEDNGNLPNCILFNGGVTKSKIIRDKIIESIQSWSPSKKSKINVLKGNNPDHAVALGASCYARVRDGGGIRIKAGSPCSYYLGVETSMPAVPGFTPPLQGLCVLPFGTEEGSSLDINFHGLGLIVGDKTEFRFFASTSKNEDELGCVVEEVNLSDSIDELSPLAATLPVTDNIMPGSLVPIKLHVDFTETGTLQVWCLNESNNGKWKLDFELRNDEI
jgi:molecular chaperone DnaK (HSP70)